MGSKVLMDVEEYLRTRFEDADCEFLDGEIVERNMGELEHSSVQGDLIYKLRQLAEKIGLAVHQEIRIQINPHRYRVADVAVWRKGTIGNKGIPSVPPFLAIEVLSPEDRMVRMQPKIQEYLTSGVECVWLIDPYERQALVYTKQNPAGSLETVLRTQNPAIEIPLSSVLPQ